MSSETITEASNSLEAPNRQGIGSLELGLTILDTIAQSPKPVSLKTLSQELSLSPSRLYKYLVSLMRTGYIVQDKTNCYSLAEAALTLGVAALRRIDPIQLTFQAVDRLHENQDVTSSVTIWNGHSPLVIKWLDASQPVSVNVRLGIELSPFFSTSGRVFLSNLPHKRMKQIVDDFYRSPPALPRHHGIPMDKEAFVQHLHEVKALNYCCFYGDYLPDINVMASAIYDINGNISSVVTIMGLTGDIDVSPGSQYHNALLACTQEVTEKVCGHR